MITFDKLDDGTVVVMFPNVPRYTLLDSRVQVLGGEYLSDVTDPLYPLHKYLLPDSVTDDETADIILGTYLLS